MPTTPEASRSAETEAAVWIEVASVWQRHRHRSVWEDLPPREAAVVRFHDPQDDLERRAAAWGFDVASAELGDLARFAAGLAVAEADAWRADDPTVATQALEQRRFLLTDRILHWAVPWLDAVGRCYPAERGLAHRARDEVLGLGDRMRCAPALAGHEGLTIPGEDSYGPRSVPAPLAERLLSVWSGLTVLKATIASIRGEPIESRQIAREWLEERGFRRDMATLYEVAVKRWSGLAEQHPGTAGLWLDLTARAAQTSAELSGSPGS